MQDSNTNMMIFKIPEVIHFLSRQITLLPGDVILTGTPHGVGTFREPPIYMKDGDVVVVEIEKVGRLENPAGHLGTAFRPCFNAQSLLRTVTRHGRNPCISQCPRGSRFLPVLP
jgi:hypothetical protein